jgi:hypothetical protein
LDDAVGPMISAVDPLIRDQNIQEKRNSIKALIQLFEHGQ